MEKMIIFRHDHTLRSPEIHTRKRKIVLSVISIVLVFSFLYVFRLKEWLAVDKCLDSGGRWNYEKGVCEFPRCPSDTFDFPKHEEIQKNIEFLIKSIDKNDFGDISDKLECYFEYIDNSLSKSNDDLSNDKETYSMIEKFGVFENGKVTLKKGKDEKVDRYIRYLEKNGIKIGYSEGSVFYCFDPMYIVNNFQNILPDIIIEYFRFEARDSEEGFEEDAVLMIPWDLLRKRIIRYENYLNRIAKTDCLFIIRRTQDDIRRYLSAYTKGTDNSGVEDNIDEIKNSYERFVSENKKSSFYPIIKEYHDILKKNDFKFGEMTVVRDGTTYTGAAIFDENNKKVWLSDIAENYSKRCQILIDDYPSRK